jgi:Uma2 family endonuclease
VFAAARAEGQAGLAGVSYANPNRIAKHRSPCYIIPMTALQKTYPVSVAEYLADEELSDVRHEYVGGSVHAMAGGNNRHGAISTNALLALGPQLRGKPCRPYNSDTRVRIEFPDHTRFYYPDAMVVCRPNPPTDHFHEQPVLVAEVFSESTRRIDLGEKRDAYLTISSLKVLLLVEPDTPEVIVHRRKPDGGFAVEIYRGLDAVIPLPEIDAALPLADLYERVDG